MTVNNPVNARVCSKYGKEWKKIVLYLFITLLSTEQKYKSFFFITVLEQNSSISSKANTQTWTNPFEARTWEILLPLFSKYLHIISKLSDTGIQEDFSISCCSYSQKSFTILPNYFFSEVFSLINKIVFYLTLNEKK